jgi:predicted carbohydrate-binding protein with CBM5 and CBM33 domain
MNTRTPLLTSLALLLALGPNLHAHGTVVSPASRVYRVYQSNPENPSFQLAANAVAIDGTDSYYSWNELSRNIPEAVQAGLPVGFDYSPWCPDGQLASGGRVDSTSTEYPRTYAGLDQVSGDWPTTVVTGGQTLQVDFLATAPHNPSVWDVWMTTPDWDPNTPLNWAQMEHLGRPQPVEESGHYLFDLTLPTDRSGHHVLWIAWQRDDPVGEVFFSTSDVLVEPPAGPGTNFCVGAPNSANPGGAQISASGSSSVSANDLVLRATQLPAGKPGIFFYGSNQVQVPFGDGFRCVSTDLTRLTAPIISDASGTLNLGVDYSGPGGGGLTPGATRHLQAWYRDVAGGPAGFNLSDGLSVMFTP